MDQLHRTCEEREKENPPKDTHRKSMHSMLIHAFDFFSSNSYGTGPTQRRWKQVGGGNRQFQALRMYIFVSGRGKGVGRGSRLGTPHNITYRQGRSRHAQTNKLLRRFFRSSWGFIIIIGVFLSEHILNFLYSSSLYSVLPLFQYYSSQGV